MCPHLYYKQWKVKCRVQGSISKVFLRSIGEKSQLVTFLCCSLSLLPSLSLATTTSSGSNTFRLHEKLTFSQSLPLALSLPSHFLTLFVSHPLVFRHFSELCISVILAPFFNSVFFFLFPVLSSICLLPSIPRVPFLLLFWCLSTGGECPADAFAIAQGDVDFFTMAALCHHGSCLSLQKPFTWSWSSWHVYRH